MVHAQMSLDEGDLNRQIARAIAHLVHIPIQRQLTFILTSCGTRPWIARMLTAPEIGRRLAPRYAHLAGTGVFEGTVTEEDGYVLVKSARLTTAGYLLGQVSLAALETDDPKLAALVARRVHGKH